MIDLSQKQSDAWHYLTDNETTEMLYGGGAGGGKSYLGCLWHIDRRLRYPKSRGVIGRASLKSIKESTLITYLKVCGLLGLRAGIDYKMNGQDMIVNFSNGSRTIFKDLEYTPSDPNFERLGSTEYTDAFVDEAGEVREKAIDILNSRIRWMLHDYGLVPKSLLTANPNHNWIKFKFIKDENGNLVKLKPHQKYVRALVDDNPDEGFKALYKQQLSRMGSQYDIDRLLFGDWDAMPRTGGEFLKKFTREDHVKKTIWTKNAAILISFDENINPYVTCLVFQVIKEDGKIYRQIDEICLPDPLNRIKYVCSEFKRRYPKHSVPKLFYYGDATSQKEDTKKEKGENFFTEVHNHLAEYSPVKMVPKANPSVIDSGQFVDEILAGNIEGLQIEIGEVCHKSIHDYSYAKEDSDGTILKKKVKHPDTGVSYEEHGHHIDALRYLIVMAEPGAFQKHKKGISTPSPIIGGREADESQHY